MNRLARPIDRVEVVHHRIPLPNRLEDATQTITHFEYVLVHLQAGGVRGSGWAYTTGFGGAGIADLVRSSLVPTALGRPTGDVRGGWLRGRRALDRGGFGALAALALGAVDIAGWDLLARSVDAPLWAVLGGHQRTCPTYGSGVDLGDGPSALADRVAGTVEAGYPAVKIKLGTDPLVNRERLVGIRTRIGPDVPLFVDANTAWSLADAKASLPALKEAGVGFLEEPFPIEDVDAYRALARTSTIPLAAGETAHSAAMLLPYVETRLLDILQPDICRIGGITEWLRIAALAETARVPLMTHFTIELAAHLAAVVPAVSFVEITDHNLTHLGLVEGGITLGRGTVQPTDAAGHGLRWCFPDESVVKSSAHDHTPTTPQGLAHDG